MDWLLLAVFSAGACFIWLSMAVARKEWREEERLRDLIFDATGVEEAAPREPLPARLARPFVLVVLPHSLDLPLAVRVAYTVTAACLFMSTMVARRDRLPFALCAAALVGAFWLPAPWASGVPGVMLIALMAASLIMRAKAPSADPAAAPTDGYFLLRNGDYAAAAAAFEAALARPMDATGVCRTLTWLAEARHAQGDTAAALSLVDAAEAAHPSKPEPHIFRASLLAGRGRYQDALPAAERGMELAPRWKVGRAVLAFVEAGALRPDESRANARQAETAEEPHPVELGPLHYYLAMAAYLREEREETRRHLTNVREVEPEGSLYRAVAEAGLASIFAPPAAS